jgi:hypothetical protein
MSTIDVPVLLEVLERTNKTFLINFSGGGEPFLVSNMIEVCVEITKKHYISFNTNLTSGKIKEFSVKINPQKVAVIHASVHIKELERLNLMNVFIDNFLSCKEKKFNIIAKEVAYPKLFSEIDAYKDFFRKHGIELIFGRFQGFYKGREYPASYTEEELKAFGVKDDAELKMYQSCRGQICNAGYNAAVVYRNGDVKRCGDVPEHLGNIYKGIKFREELFECPVNHCHCPISVYDVYLFERARKESELSRKRE